MKRMRFSRHQYFILGVIAVSLLLIALWLVAMLLFPSPPTIVLRPITSKPAPSAFKSFFSKWEWKIKDTVLGRRRTVEIGTIVFRISAGAETDAIARSLKSVPFGGENAPKIWIVDQDDMQRLNNLKDRRGREIVGRPRLITADGVEASMFIGNSIVMGGTNANVGIEFTAHTRVRRQSTDLNLTIISTTAQPLGGSDAISVRSNLAVAARIQVPRGKGIFILNDGAAATNANSEAMLVTVKALDPSK
jgi:hypothetical protein